MRALGCRRAGAVGVREAKHASTPPHTHTHTHFAEGERGPPGTSLLEAGEQRGRACPARGEAVHKPPLPSSVALCPAPNCTTFTHTLSQRAPRSGLHRRVHGVNLPLVLLLQLRALELERGGHQLVLHAEHLVRRLDVERLDQLKALAGKEGGGQGGGPAERAPRTRANAGASRTPRPPTPPPPATPSACPPWRWQ